MKHRDLEQVAKGVALGFGPKFHDIEKRLAKLEAAQQVADNYKGTWRKSLNYTRGQLVTHRNSLWLCESDTATMPGSGADWRLVSKNGEPPRAHDDQT